MVGHGSHGLLVGRRHERAQLEQFLDSVGSGASALVLEGDAGIGKTALWQWGVEVARQRGWRILVARPAQAETALAFAALEDLFENVGGDELAALPAPQRSALAVALRSCLLFHGWSGYGNDLPFAQRHRDIIKPRGR